MATLVKIPEYGGVKIVRGANEQIIKIERAQINPIQNGAYEIIYDGTVLDTDFVDYTCECGKDYWYKVTFSNSIIQVFSEAISVDFDDIILIGESDIPKLVRLNPNLSSVKRNQSQSITQTIGGKYPVIRKNGNMDYYTFSLGGLITMQAETVYNGRSVSYDYIAERNYRNEFVNFLSDGKIKLFKSPQEGNLLIRLTDINLSPENGLGRLIYNFSATATEIAEANMSNYSKYKLVLPSTDVLPLITVDLQPFYVVNTEA